MSLLRLFEDVKAERVRQVEKWGVQDHTVLKWFVILTEEFGEAAKEINEVVFRDKPITDLRAELIQTIAVATRMIEEIDNGPDK